MYAVHAMGIAVLVSSALATSYLRNTLNLDDRTFTRSQCLQARPRWHGLRQEVDVYLVHRGEVLHICEVDVVFDNLLKR